MAAYAAVLSLMHILDLIKNHPSPPISLDKQQVDYLTEILTFLQEFLEVYVSPFTYTDEADPLEIHISEAVYAVEDVIESCIADNIQLAADEIRHINFYEDLQKVTEAMDLIKKEAMGIIKQKGRHEVTELPRNASADAGFKSRSSERNKSTMVGFEDELLDLKERLLRRDPNRQIIPIVGMGGIGKTTLARKVFGEQLITEHFDICVWATISQDYNIKQTLREILSQIRGGSTDRGGSGDQSEEELGEKLYKSLSGMRYLVVMDDMWRREVWDKMSFFFPDCGQGSRVIVTTRMSDLASHFTNSSNSLCMSFLNEDDSRTLFSKTVFGDIDSFRGLDLELREVGERIVKKCKGLPLSIDVIGGLLSRLERTQGNWEYIENNLSSIVNLENEEYCLRILKLSYNNLPTYLKPCFLYMGVFDEDSEIKISTIIKLWVSEGFLKPSKKNENLETIAREYFQELVDRNLVLVLNDQLESLSSNLGLVGNAKFCKMHDLLRDLSLREAKKQRFYYVVKQHSPPPPPPPPRQEGIIDSRRRIIIADGRRLVDPFVPMPYLRSVVCFDPSFGKFSDLRLLRTLHTTYREGSHNYSHADLSRLVNSRLLAIAVKMEWPDRLVSSISQLWSLHTLIVDSIGDFIGPVEFWDMHQLKHVEFRYGSLHLQLPPAPSNNDNNIIIMEKLHTLIGVKDFHLDEYVVTRIPNVKKLNAIYKGKLYGKHSMSYLQCLSKLESFRCRIYYENVCHENLQEICFPRSLKQIILGDIYSGGRNIELEDILQKAGWLPLLEELKLLYVLSKSGVWKTSEGQFPRLKLLELHECRNLRNWTVSGNFCFPLLQKLSLSYLTELEEIPPEIGEIATLKSIVLQSCNKSVVLSAEKIVEEQENLYGEKQTILSYIC